MFWISAAIVWGAVFWGYVYKRSEEAKRLKGKRPERVTIMTAEADLARIAAEEKRNLVLENRTGSTRAVEGGGTGPT